jgi:ABC-type antimicrobial peptide transport system permease subunit
MYSKRALFIEIFLLMVILLSILSLISGLWMLLVLMLFLLISILFFQTDSIVRAFPPDGAIDVSQAPESLKWIDNGQETTYPSAEIKIFITRWFILLKLGKGKSQVSKLLLSDSFADINHYTNFRRHLIEMYIYASDSRYQQD